VLLLGSLADVAEQAGRPGLSRPAFISGALWELSLALCSGHACLCRSGLYAAVTAQSSRAQLRGQSRPLTEVAEYCLVRGVACSCPHVELVSVVLGLCWGSQLRFVPGVGFVRTSTCSAWAFPMQALVVFSTFYRLSVT
jgi:hypothetical protein